MSNSVEEDFNSDLTGADCSICTMNTDFCLECIAMRKAAYLAGRADERKRCVLIANSWQSECDCSAGVGGRIASLIERQEDKP